MEIPENLKTLYNHWPYYTQKPLNNRSQLSNSSDIKEIEKFIIERMLIWEKKVSNERPPYTTDPILAKYRFCNIYRELDRQTIEIHSKLFSLSNNFELWLLNVAFMRFICNPATIEKVDLLGFDKSNNKKVFERLSNLPRPKYGTAYIFPISIIMKSEYPTREEFFCFYLPKVIPKIAKLIQSFNKSSVVDALEAILPEFGFKMKFHWTEILIDIAYQFPELIDLNKRFPIGPGSLPTMKNLFPDQDPEETCLELSNYIPKDFTYLSINGKDIYLTCETWEGIGCEFRKYTNLKNGSGRRRLYK